ncbi:PREDICTED: homocysteine S-methyltransferase YbgG-like [Dinoponera quadriceps]|uniref:Homocysteine S-methyltransferase YbgG-like n=1 Tax=Dinoponera quadriceps TaxID=609295 RepID=A0A6P3WY21_DINQU|nr:PREDICTED: homocysteine S-methyltransferase YbgG-like [Dinoponera quadriceps]
MDKLMVFDGNFEAELRNHLSTTKNLGRQFAVKALEFDRLAVYKTHLAYLHAGAQIIRTNTKRVIMNSLKRRKYFTTFQESSIDIAVKLAKQAITKYYEEVRGDSASEDFSKHRPLLAGCCGSYSVWNFFNISDIRKNLKNMSQSEMYWFHKIRVKKLMEAGVDLLTFESIPCHNEAKAIRRLLMNCPDARAWITFLCSQEGKLIDGSNFATVATDFYDSLPNQIVAIGVEGVTFDSMKLMMQDVNGIRDIKIPFVLYVEKRHFPITDGIGASSSVARNFAEEWINEGVRYFGGSTDIVADNIKKIRKEVDKYCASTGMVFTPLKVRVCSHRDKDNQSKL